MMVKTGILSLGVLLASCGIIGTKKSDSGSGSSGPGNPPTAAQPSNAAQNGEKPNASGASGTEVGPDGDSELGWRFDLLNEFTATVAANTVTVKDAADVAVGDYKEIVIVRNGNKMKCQYIYAGVTIQAYYQPEFSFKLVNVKTNFKIEDSLITDSTHRIQVNGDFLRIDDFSVPSTLSTNSDFQLKNCDTTGAMNFTIYGVRD